MKNDLEMNQNSFKNASKLNANSIFVRVPYIRARINRDKNKDKEKKSRRRRLEKKSAVVVADDFFILFLILLSPREMARGLSARAAKERIVRL